VENNMGYKKAKYVISSCKDCVFYRKIKKYSESTSDMYVDFNPYYEYYCLGKQFEKDELKKKFLIKGECYIVDGYSAFDVETTDNKK
jgi:hypothetical protein